MTDLKEIVAELADTLADDVSNHDALAALGMVMTGVICDAAEPGPPRRVLVETVCDILRKSIFTDLN